MARQGRPASARRVHVHVEFTQGPATTAGATGGDDRAAPAAYDVGSTDFWKKLDQFTVARQRASQPVDADKLAKDPDAQACRPTSTR